MRIKLYGFMAALIGIFLFAAPSFAGAEKVVVIDPGHGGRFSGTCGLTGSSTGICEENNNLNVALKLKSLLESRGITVKMTRSDDRHFSTYLSGEGGDLDKRTQVANGFATNNNDNTVFISVHHNAHPRDPYVKGIETYYYDGVNHYQSEYPHDPLQIKYLPDNKRLATNIHSKLIPSLGTLDRGVRNNQSFYVIRNAKMPAVLLELGFMTNREEESRIKTSSYQWAAAKAIAEGVVNYYKVFEVFDENNKRLATFTTLEEAKTYVSKQTKLAKVFDKTQQKFVFENGKFIVVHKENGYLKEFYSIDEAIKFASNNGETRIYDKYNRWTVWSNYLTKKYAVKQSETVKEELFDYNQAVTKANELENSYIVRNDTGEVIWSKSDAVKVERSASPTYIAGSGRIQTSIEISKKMYPNGFAADKAEKIVLLTTGVDPADALSAGPLSGLYGKAPIILSEADVLVESVKTELKRLKASKVVIIGGPAAIDTVVENQIKGLGIQVDRINGSNRYDTNRKILAKLGNVNGYFVASGKQYADALAVAPIAASQNWGIVLTDLDKVSDVSVNLMAGKPVRIVGGDKVVGSAVEAKIKEKTSNLVRLAGSNRYDTLAKVLWAFGDKLESETVLLTTGENFPDALAAAPLAVNNPAPLILINGSVKVNLESFLLEHGENQSIKEVLVIGGTLSKDAVTEVTNKVK
ncbi:N-acetylmuramoyl-L-alanine amidase [Mesobacillus jeotgali]|uniref:N-acetylmuramoyl-L-alanine amidase n=1 Tax=Mesobacillus jeotgali TaxID=129985 RepID=UPI000C8614C4|nr:N-acetylmuramoyl-L-alanine amidase [Mesobacillus jeotgali]